MYLTVLICCIVQFARPKMEDGPNRMQYTFQGVFYSQPRSRPARELLFDVQERERKRREIDGLVVDRIRLKKEESLHLIQKGDEGMNTSETRKQKASNAKVLAAISDYKAEHEQRRKEMERDDERKPFAEKPKHYPKTREPQNHYLGQSILALQKMNRKPFLKDDQRSYEAFLEKEMDRHRSGKKGNHKVCQGGKWHSLGKWGRHGGGSPKDFNRRYQLTTDAQRSKQRSKNLWK